MTVHCFTRVLAAALCLCAFAGASAADSPAQKKAEIRKMRAETLPEFRWP